MPDAWKNKLFFGDNLGILRDQIQSESVDLVYLDPPFNSNANYNVLFQEKTGQQSAAQITAFEDTWYWTQESENTYHEIVSNSSERLIILMMALRSFLGTSDMIAYLIMMASRLVELHRVLKDTGTIYLHCDSTATDYLKLMLDSIFDARNFVNEVIWKRTTAHSDRAQGSKHYGRIHDSLLVYAKSPEYTWNQSYEEHSEKYLDSHYTHIEEGTGRRYRLDNLTGPGGAAKGNPSYEVMGVTRYWRYSREKMQALIEKGRIIQTKKGAVPQYKRYLDEMKGRPLQDVWDDLPPINSQAKERLGYPTQKPEALLERIINTSSDEEDVILDPFCGCGTTITVAEKLHRRWVGIDLTHLAISLIRHRLHDTFKTELAPYEVIGDPKDLQSAEALALEDRYQFQWWAVGLLDGRAMQDKKKGKDTGIDGSIFFFDDSSGKAKRIILQVKSGNVKSGDVRDLKGTMEREKAQIGVFITLKPPTKDMTKEAVSAGYYETEHFGKYPKLQIIT